MPEGVVEPLALAEEWCDPEAGTLAVAEGDSLVNGEALPEEQVVGVGLGKVEVKGEAEPENRGVRAGEGDADPEDVVVGLDLGVGVESRGVSVGTAGTMEGLGAPVPEAAAEGEREGERAALREREGEAVADVLALGLRVVRGVLVAQEEVLGEALGEACAGVAVVE